MNTSPATRIAQRLFEESSLASSREPIDVMLVSALLERHYHVGGRLERLGDGEGRHVQAQDRLERLPREGFTP